MEEISLPLKYGRACTPSPQICKATSLIKIEIPMVMIIILSTEGLSSQRIKIISIRAPIIMVTHTARAIAKGRGRK